MLLQPFVLKKTGIGILRITTPVISWNGNVKQVIAVTKVSLMVQLVDVHGSLYTPSLRYTFGNF